MGSDNSDALYGYQPNRALAIATSAIFLALFLAHSFVTTKYKAWKYMWAFNLGIGMEVAGYALRRVSADHVDTGGQGVYIGQILCIILAPAVLAASMYMTFGRLVRYVNDKISPVRSTWVTRIFVSFDVMSFLVQITGGSLYSGSNQSLYSVAKAILIVGFVIQMVAFSVFLLFAIIYHRRALRSGVPTNGWQRILYTLYIGAVLILIRSCFRTIEFSQGDATHSALQAHEAYYYSLEALPILLCVIAFLVSHPGRYIPTDPNARLLGLTSDTTPTQSLESDVEKARDAPSKKFWSRSKA